METKSEKLKPMLELPGGKKIYNIRGQKFEVSRNYHLTKVVGFGAYGTVCAAVAEDSNTRVAIKRVSNIFHDLREGRRVLREMEIMATMRHANLIRLRRFIRPQAKETFVDMYFVMDLFDTDLHRIIRSGQKLTNEHYQYFMVQAFRGLNYLHSAKIMHRDLKPSNLLVNADCALAICDFGLARDEQVEATPDLTQYVVTRWYRPPEVLGMGANQYTNAVDVWSMGLIFAELMVGKTLLQGGDYIGQLMMIVNLLGTPAPEDMEFLSPEARNFLCSMPPQPSRRFQDLFPKAPPEACDLLSKVLVFHPAKRLTARQVIEHPYFAKFRDPSQETTAPLPFVGSENKVQTEQDLRNELWRLIVENSPENDQ